MIIGIHSGRKGGISEQSLHYLLQHTGQAFEIFPLIELELQTCDACLKCVKTNLCCKPDGLVEIYNNMHSADAVVFAAPEYWEGINAKARAFWERICFMGRHNEGFPLSHLKGVIIGISGTGDSSAGMTDLRRFMEDARIQVINETSVQGSYACFDCGFGASCGVSGLRDICSQPISGQSGSGLTELNPNPGNSVRPATIDILEKAAIQIDRMLEAD